MPKIVSVKGTIVANEDKWIYDLFDIDAVCPKDVEKQLNDANGADATVQINSGGGDIGAGNEIAYLIGEYQGKTIADIVGYCCSAATLVACMADKARMAPSALYMIHNVSGGGCGDYRDLSHTSVVLKTASEAISKTYQQKTGKSQSELLTLMDNETWLTAEKAKENGFIDEIIGDDTSKSLINAFGTVLSDETKNKIRNMVNNQQKLLKNDNADFLMRKNTALANIKLLEMEGEI